MKATGVRRARRTFPRTFLFALALAAGAPGAAAQTAPTAQTPNGEQAKPAAAPLDAPQAAPTPPARQPAPASKAPQPVVFKGLTVAGSLRLRAENWGWFETPGFDDEYNFGAAVLRLSVGQQREKFDWLVEGEFPALFNLPERAVAPAPRGQLGLGANYFVAAGRQDAGAVLKQAYVRVKGFAGDRPGSLRAGRFEFADATETTPADGTHRTFFQVLPTPRIYARFPFYNLMNNEDLFAQLKLRPHARVHLRADVRHLRLSNANDLWYSGGGAFQEGTFGYAGRASGGHRSLGTLFDLSADITVTPTTTLTFYGAGVRGGRVPAATYPRGGGPPSHASSTPNSRSASKSREFRAKTWGVARRGEGVDVVVTLNALARGRATPHVFNPELGTLYSLTIQPSESWMTRWP